MVCVRLTTPSLPISGDIHTLPVSRPVRQLGSGPEAGAQASRLERLAIGARYAPKEDGYYISYCRLCSPNGVSSGRDWNGMGADRHSDGANCVFLDGHGKWIAKQKLLNSADTQENRKFWNHSPS